MKIAAIALASTLASVAFTQPSFAQQNQNQSDQSNQNQYGPGSQSQLQNGRDGGWHQGRNWRDDDDNFGGGWGRMHRFGMQRRMERMWEHHNRFANEGEGAHFRLRRGQAMIDVKCPDNEPLQACVNAASQLLDKVASMRNGNTATGMTNGSGLSTGDMTGSPPSGSSSQGTITPGAGGKLPGQD